MFLGDTPADSLSRYARSGTQHVCRILRGADLRHMCPSEKLGSVPPPVISLSSSACWECSGSRKRLIGVHLAMWVSRSSSVVATSDRRFHSQLPLCHPSWVQNIKLTVRCRSTAPPAPPPTTPISIPSMAISAASVVGHTTTSFPRPHILYTIEVKTTDGKTSTALKRYSEVRTRSSQRIRSQLTSFPCSSSHCTTLSTTRAPSRPSGSSQRPSFRPHGLTTHSLPSARPACPPISPGS